MTWKDKIRAVLWVIYALIIICGAAYIVATRGNAADYAVEVAEACA